VVQDLALGLMLAVLPALNQPPELISIAVLTALLRIGLFAAGAVAAGIWIIPSFCGFGSNREPGAVLLGGSSVSGHCVAHRAFRAFN